MFHPPCTPKGESSGVLTEPFPRFITLRDVFFFILNLHIAQKDCLCDATDVASCFDAEQSKESQHMKD